MSSSAAAIGGLQLLLDNYSDSDHDHEEADTGGGAADNNPAKEVKQKLPLPVGVTDMFPEKTDATNNNSADYGGRIRSFVHVRGNWASYVFLPFSPKNKSLSGMAEVVRTSLEEFPDQPNVTINDEFHLSLSKTIVLHHHWIEPFIQSLKTAFRIRKRVDIIFTEFKVYLNEEKTRTFIGMNIFASETLMNLVKDCDVCLSEYGLEKYYQDASFHVSIAWCVGNHDKWMRTHLLPLINSKWTEMLDNDSSLQVSTTKSIELKTGNKIYQFLLEQE